MTGLQSLHQVKGERPWRTETTCSIRKRLRFLDDELWRSFTVKRLRCVQDRGLHKKKASEQEAEIEQVAHELRSELNFDPKYQVDFEKLVRVGIQSVRRNLRRPMRSNNASDSDDSTGVGSLKPVTLPGAYLCVRGVSPTDPFKGFTFPQVTPDSNSAQNGVFEPQCSPNEACFAGFQQDQAPLAADALNSLKSHSRPLSAPTPGTMPSLVDRNEHQRAHSVPPNRLKLDYSGVPNPVPSDKSDDGLLDAMAFLRQILNDHSLPDAVEFPSPLSDIIAGGVVRRALGMSLTRFVFAKDASHVLCPSLENGQLASALCSYLCPARSSWKLQIARANALCGNELHDGLMKLLNLLLSRSNGDIKLMLEILERYCGPLALSNVPKTESFNSFNGTDSPLTAHLSNLPLIWAQRDVSLRFNQQVLNFTFSPLKNSPPSLGELIENARSAFRLPNNTIVRVRDAKRGRILDSTTDLAEAFQSMSVDLELFLPPPMMPNCYVPVTNYPVAPQARR